MKSLSLHHPQTRGSILSSNTMCKNENSLHRVLGSINYDINIYIYIYILYIKTSNAKVAEKLDAAGVKSLLNDFLNRVLVIYS
ncbi:hypothetical protein PUN28_006284 [Cardiocondyla obscurior]|uniref:Uncharacterized protein n=1 Tax=Cardiocondyla obscurior TaxID=286306 RepID=A0AAW2G7X8_9HYME